jgi:hypothetical protein
MRRSGRLLPKMRRQERDLRARDTACDKVEFDRADTMTIPSESPRFIPFPLTGLATLVAPAKCQWQPAGSIEVIEPQPPRATAAVPAVGAGWFLPPRYMAGGVSPGSHWHLASLRALPRRTVTGTWRGALAP